MQEEVGSGHEKVKVVAPATRLAPVPAHQPKRPLPHARPRAAGDRGRPAARGQADLRDAPRDGGVHQPRPGGWEVGRPWLYWRVGQSLACVTGAWLAVRPGPRGHSLQLYRPVADAGTGRLANPTSANTAGRACALPSAHQGGGGGPTHDLVQGSVCAGAHCRHARPSLSPTTWPQRGHAQGSPPSRCAPLLSGLSVSTLRMPLLAEHPL